MKNFHEFDPWEFLQSLSEQQAAQAISMLNISVAHNVSQEQISELIRQQHSIMLKISALSTAISQLAQAINKERT
jgi:DNA polymerase III delta subunit